MRIVVAFILGFALAALLYVPEISEVVLTEVHNAYERIQGRPPKDGPLLESVRNTIASVSATQTAQTEVRLATRTTKLEQAVYAGVNALRVENESSALIWDAGLGRIARAHSEDMVKRGFTGHVNPSGLTSSDHAQQAGHACRYVAENITVVLEKGLGAMAEDATKGWRGSPKHHSILMDRNFKRTGIGVAFGLWSETEGGRKYKAVYLTQVFC